MSKREIIICDRCGHEEDARLSKGFIGYSWVEFEIYRCGVSDSVYKHKVDLCSSCHNSLLDLFSAWMKEGKKK